MSHYKHILVGLDLSPDESKIVAEKAAGLAQLSNAKISLAHIIEPLTFAYAGDIPVDISSTQDAMEQHAQDQLARVAEQLPIKPDSVNVVIGQTGAELRELAGSLGADLIAVGSHARHGLALILGNTASDVLHGANCDVLAVRIG